jgi:hypothetical protein
MKATWTGQLPGCRARQDGSLRSHRKTEPLRTGAECSAEAGAGLTAAVADWRGMQGRKQTGCSQGARAQEDLCPLTCLSGQTPQTEPGGWQGRLLWFMNAVPASEPWPALLGAMGMLTAHRWLLRAPWTVRAGLSITTCKVWLLFMSPTAVPDPTYSSCSSRGAWLGSLSNRRGREAPVPPPSGPC